MMTATLHVHVAWWVRPYIRIVALLCVITETEPNMERFRYWISKGVTVKAKPVR